MAKTKLYPPQLEGSLPAFYKKYNADNELTGAIINIPFGVNRAVSMSSVTGLAIRIRTTSTNTYLASDYKAIQYDPEANIASFEFKQDEKTNKNLASLFNEGQYYRVQLAFIDKSNKIGYYSTVGVIKCVAPPLDDTVIIDGYQKNNINPLKNNITGVYTQNTYYGDTTEKVYSYKFDIYNAAGILLETSGELVHDVTQDVASDTSSDRWRIYNDYPVGEVLNIQYTVTTLNGLVLSSPMYRAANTVSVKSEFDIQIHAKPNFDNGYINLTLSSKLSSKENQDTVIYKPVTEYDSYSDEIEYLIKQGEDEYLSFSGTEAQWEELVARNLIYVIAKSITYGEPACSGYFLITRASSQDNFFTWVDIERFVMVSDFPSSFIFTDKTVEQGIEYKYAIQQYNIHGLESDKEYQTDENGVYNTVIADFEDMFLSDGNRQLRIRFNPKVSSFKSTIPEQKIETIGSKYPFIFRNGSVCYKEFPIAGLISYQMDEATLFLNEEELRQAGIMEKTRARLVSNYDSYIDAKGHEIHFYLEERTMPIYDKYTGIKLYDKNYAVGIRLPETEWVKKSDQSYAASAFSYEKESKKANLVRMDKNLTTENLQGERYFKLKVLDWLNNGKVKLFRSPAEGNYLVRLINVSLSPTDALGRMLHSFTCTGYEIADLTYDNLISLGLINESITVRYEEQWATVDMHEMMKDPHYDSDGFMTISPDGVAINGISIQDFAPGDQIRITYDNGDIITYVVGVTGSLDLSSDERTIIQVDFKPNPDVYGDFERNFVYQTTNMTRTKFDAIRDVLMSTVVAEQFVGPQENLLEPFILRDVAYGVRDEDGLVLNPISQEEGFQAIYDDIKAHHRFNYQIDNYNGSIVEKFTGLKMDYLHVFKRNIIPIFCYDETVSATSRFGVTPFGIGYVNNTPIINYLDFEDNVIYSNPVIQEENGLHILNEGVNIDDIQTLLQENGLMQHPFDILKIFIYNKTNKQWEAIQDGEEYQYFDCYTKTWWEAGTQYDASFSINEPRIYPERTAKNQPITLPEYIGDNNIYLNNINELTLYNIGEISHIRLGNGVVAEISMQMRVVDYDIEESDDEVRAAKNTYLNAKSSFETTLDNVMENSDYYTVIKNQYDEYLELLNNVKSQLVTISQNGQTTDLVFEAAEKRVINQKKQLWYGLINQLKDIIKILQETKIYTAITQVEEDKIPIIGNDSPFDSYVGDSEAIISASRGTVIADPENTFFEEYPENLHSSVNSLKIFKAFLESRMKGKQYDVNDLVDIENTFSEATNYLIMSQENSPVTKVLKNKDNPEQGFIENQNAPIGSTEEQKQQFDRVNNFFYIYAELLQQQIAEETAKIADYTAKIETLEAQCGELVGGYLEEYDETNPPPENTIVYYDYQISLIDAQIQQALNDYNNAREALIDKLLISIFADDADLLTGFTDEYIQENAEALVELLTSTDTTKLGRIPQRERELQELQDKFFPSIACLIFGLKDEEGTLLINNVTENQKRDVEHIFNGTLSSIKKVTKNTTTDPETNAETTTEVITYEDSTNSHIYTAILNRLNNEIDLETLYTDYIKVYEDQGITTPVKSFLLDSFVDIAAYCAAYELYENSITTALTTMNQQLTILQQIVIDPGSISREYGSIINQYSADGVAQLKTTSGEIKDAYIINTSETVNQHFAEQVDEHGNRIITKDFEDLANISADATRDDKANIILNLLVDQYNRSQAASVNTYLNKYTNESLASENADTSALMSQLKNIEYVYQNRRTSLNNERKIYSDQRESYAKELDSLKENITTFENEKLASQEKLKNAQELDKYNLITEAAHVQESEELITDIIEDSAHQLNVTLLKDYVQWILWLQESLQKQVGQIFAGITNGNQYAEMMQKYINLYEKEAFEFLHWFDALPEDLEDGFQGTGGMNRKFKTPNSYFLKDYKNILYLSAPTKDSPNTSLDKTTNTNKVTREEAYVELEEYLKDLFSYHLMDDQKKATKKYISLRVCPPNPLENPPSHPAPARLLELRKPGADSDAARYKIEDWYPDMYEFGTNTLFNPEDSMGWDVLRLDDEDHEKTYVGLLYAQEENDDGEKVNKVYKTIGETKLYEYEVVPFKMGEYRLLAPGEEKITSNTEYLRVNGTIDGSVFYQNRNNANFIAAYNAAIYEAIDNNYRVVWQTEYKPLSIEYQPYDLLYPLSSVKAPTEYTSSLAQYFDPDANKQDDNNLLHGYTEIQVSYNDNFDKALGLIVYDYDETLQSYVNCIASLREIDRQIRENLSSYLLVYYGIYLSQTSKFLKDFIDIRANINVAKNKEEEALRLLRQCEIVNDNQIAAGMSNDLPERIQLLYLLTTAREEYNDYQKQRKYWEEKEQELLMNTPELKYYQLYTTILPQLASKYKNCVDRFNTEYKAMQKKLDHYLKLLFNNEPYGNLIDPSVLQHRELLEETGSDNMYNFGIAYAIEKYREGRKQGSNPISFSEILDSKNEIETILNKHYNPFTRVIPEYDIDEETGETVLTTRYNSSTMVYKNPDTHKYETYFKINDIEWEKDLLNHRIYSSDYLSLNSILNVFSFELVPAGIIFDENECYYIYDAEDNKYIEQEVTAETYSNLKPVLYWKKRNGGILGILRNLTAEDSAYFQEIKDAYLGSLDLYKTLQKQALGDETLKTELEQLRDEYQFHVDSLQQILDQFDGNSNFDNDGGLDNIIRALAEFLRILTVAYVTKVERSYGVI